MFAAMLAAVSRGMCGEVPPVVEGQKGMVVSASRAASEIGCDVLKQGGNAVDAAVATALALAVTWPEAGNIGGGGFMLVYPGGGAAPVVIDYRETAPAAATVDMFAPDESQYTHRAVGVPGTVAGLALAQRKFGRLKWPDLVVPAIRLAEESFPLSRELASSLNELTAESSRDSELRRVFGKPSDTPDAQWQPGDRLRQPDLARTLRRLANLGPDDFYRGETAALLVREMELGQGLITADDLAAYEARVREPIHCTFRGYDVFAPPPPSSGGICLIQMLNVLELLDLRSHPRFSADALHLQIEAIRRAYCDRARYLGDSDFTEIPAHLTSREYAAELARGVSRDRATPSAELAPELLAAEESSSTTHFSVVDGQGMAVANTYTLEQSYGARIVVRGAGFLLNNEMGDFNWRPGVTNHRGTIGTPPNRIAPGKRMLSSMTPTIVARDGRAVLVTGSPGGRTIINTVLSVLVQRLEYEQPLAEAVAAPRLHHAWFPDEVRFEGRLDPRYTDAMADLQRRGHRVAPDADRQGDAHSIEIEAKTGMLRGVADPRREGAAVGY